MLPRKKASKSLLFEMELPVWFSLGWDGLFIPSLFLGKKYGRCETTSFQNSKQEGVHLEGAACASALGVGRASRPPNSSRSACFFQCTQAANRAAV